MPTNDTGRPSTFGRALMSYVTSKLPYSQPYSLIDDIARVNPKYKDFYETGTRAAEIATKHSVSTNKQGLSDGSPMSSMAVDKNYHAFMYANVDHDKAKRLRDYRVMAQFAEVADALDEFCDEGINKDDQGKIVRLEILPSDRLDEPGLETTLNDEFDQFIQLYNLENKGWEYFRQLLIDGEVYFEHIIHKEKPEAGILGILQVPSELLDPIYDNVQNLQIRGFLLRKPMLDKKDTQGQSNNPTDKVEYVPFDRNQMTYIHSGIWNESKTLRLPFIEMGRRAYRQLSLIEDSIIIYRLVRAPERLVFNVDVGNMPPPKAEAYLRRLMQSYWSRKTYDANQGMSVQAFNPQSMLDAFWFAKRAGGEGTEVKSLPGGANLGELEDLKYFRQKLFRALKVPVARLESETSVDTQGATILREELKFARFIIRIQQSFATGLREAFVTHLKLKGIWEKSDLREHQIRLYFNPPSNFQELRNQQIYELKWNNYTNAIGNPLISDTYAKKHLLKMTNEEIKVNKDLLKKDRAFSWELAQIEAMGPNWREQFEAQAGGEMAPGGDMGMGGMPMGGGMDMGAPPEFGPAPEVGAPADVAAPAPVGGAETALP